jgi:hypothetical protein
MMPVLANLMQETTDLSLAAINLVGILGGENSRNRL